MPDRIIEPIGIPEFFADGFGNYTMSKGILRCVGYSLIRGERFGVVRLVIAGEGAANAIELTQRALDGDQPIAALGANTRRH